MSYPVTAVAVAVPVVGIPLSSSSSSASSSGYSGSSCSPFPPAAPDVSGGKASVPPVAPVAAAALPDTCDEGAIMAFLRGQLFPQGLIDTTVASIKSFPLRYFILDDSGSMMTADGNRVMPGGRDGEATHERCTRWEEMKCAVKFHLSLARAAKCHASFRFLNGPQISLPADGERGVSQLELAMNESPRGTTPLCARIQEVINEININAAMLRQRRQKAVVIIMTDGESSDGDLANAMRPLEQLPAWVVIRLSTDDEHVMAYWNEIDAQLELELDVLDDIVSEAHEVKSHNPFLHYGTPLHRLREWGFHVKEIDLLDEQALTLEQIHSTIKLIFGTEIAGSLLVPTTATLSAYVAQWEIFVLDNVTEARSMV